MLSCTCGSASDLLDGSPRRDGRAPTRLCRATRTRAIPRPRADVPALRRSAHPWRALLPGVRLPRRREQLCGRWGRSSGARPMTVAALYVEKGGVYYGIEDVDPWDEERDAR